MASPTASTSSLATSDNVITPAPDALEAPFRLNSRDGPSAEQFSQQNPKGPEEGDTCRICRSEGTKTEPLFYPCKCSGSIKFVHQECLMEWLSHTQKKYCELCKTPFRFTKLYHPQMPTRLPTAVFLRRAVFHLLAYMLTWCRALLVAFVWIVCLPWCMRSAWSMMFWFGDAGWARDRLVNETTISAWMDEHLAGIQKLPFQESNATNETVTAALEHTASAGGKYILNPTRSAISR